MKYRYLVAKKILNKILVRLFSLLKKLKIYSRILEGLKVQMCLTFKDRSLRTQVEKAYLISREMRVFNNRYYLYVVD